MLEAVFGSGMRAPLWGLLGLAACAARPGIGASDEAGTGDGTGDGTGTASASSGTDSASTSASTGDPDTGESGTETGPPPDCEGGPGGVVWSKTLDSELQASASAVAVDFSREVSVAGNEGDNPTLWRLDADGGLRWKSKLPLIGRTFGVGVNEIGEPFMGWNQTDAVAYMHFGLDAELLLESIAVQPGRYGADLAVIPFSGVAVPGVTGMGGESRFDLLRFADDGILLWEFVEPDDGLDGGLGVAVADGRIFVAGDGGGDFLVAAFALDGERLWQRVIEGGPSEYATAIAVDPSGDVAVSGVCLDNDLQPQGGWIGRYDGQTGADLWDYLCGDFSIGPALDIAALPNGEYAVAGSLDNTPAAIGFDASGESTWSHAFLAPNDVKLSVTTIDADACNEITVAGGSNLDVWAARVRPEG